MTHTTKKPSRKQLDAVVLAWQLYSGSFEYADVRQQQKLYKKAFSLTERLVKRYDLDMQSTYDQICAEATRRGAIRPTVGRDI